MDQQQTAAKQITVFYSYAHADERLRKQLETHLSLLRKQGIIATWHDRQIVPGTDWAHEIDVHLTRARVVLLLISPDFIASDYCYGVELQRAMERHTAGEARVISILLRPVADWDKAQFARLTVLPTNRKPITKWRNRDEAWADVVAGIRRALQNLEQVQARTSVHQESPVLPVSLPREREGNVADIPFFPNPRAQEEQASQIETSQTLPASKELTAPASQTAKLPTEVTPPSRPPAEIPLAGPPRRGIPRRTVVTGLVGVAVVGVVGSGFVWLGLDRSFRSVMPSPAGRSTPTVEPALTTVPSGTQVLFSDNFQSDPTGQLPRGWKIVAGTWVVGTDVTKVLKQTDINSLTAKVITAGSTSWTDYRVQARIKPGSTGQGIAYSLNSRYYDNGNAYSAYSLVLKNGNNWFFGKVVDGIWTTFASGSRDYNISTWYRLQIDAVGSKISAFLDGSLLHSVTDPSLASGNIALRALQVGEFTDVVVTQLG